MSIKVNKVVSITIDGDDVRILSDVLQLAHNELRKTHGLITTGSIEQGRREQNEREAFISKIWDLI